MHGVQPPVLSLHSKVPANSAPLKWKLGLVELEGSLGLEVIVGAAGWVESSKAKMVSASPTAEHLEVFRQETLSRLVETPELWLHHVEPPFDIALIVPEGPTAKQVEVVGQETLRREIDVPEVWLVHVEPLFVVARIVPRLPTATQVEVLGQEMLRREYDVPEVWLVHVEPPFVVALIVPELPTAKQVEVVGQETLRKESDVPGLWFDHVEPPFVVARIVPELPTAKQVEVLGQETPKRELPVTPALCIDQSAASARVIDNMQPKTAMQAINLRILRMLNRNALCAAVLISASSRAAHRKVG